MNRVRKVHFILNTLTLLFAAQVAVSQTIPDNFPKITTEIYDEEALGNGKIFLASQLNYEGIGTYLMILENDGSPYWFKDLGEDADAWDFKMQPNGFMSYGYGYESNGFSGGAWQVTRLMDKSFHVVDSFDMLNGYKSEAHDFQILPNGHVIMFTYALESFDLTAYGGYPYAQLAGTIIQELDAEKKLVNQWRFWDFFNPSDIHEKYLTNNIADVVHNNSIDLDRDGHFLVSERNLGTCAKINRQTGDVMWHLGGELNDFSYTGIDSTVANAWFGGHDLRRLPNGNISYFVNNWSGETKQTSKVAEFRLDEENLVAELVWLYQPENSVKANSMSSAQKLTNNNYFIGWGTSTWRGDLVCSEVSANMDLLFELNWEGVVTSYRAFRFDINTDIPTDSVSRNDLSIGTYEFSSGDTVTGISLDITTLDESAVNSVNVMVYDYAPFKPIFAGKDPMVAKKRIVVSGEEITSISGNLIFDTSVFNISNPDEITIYQRETVGEGEFFPLSTSYHPAKGSISAAFDKFGEFIFTYPDLPSVPFSPNPFKPKMDEVVNQETTIRMEWSPRGFISKFELQIATDENFTSLVVNENNLANPVYEFTPSDNQTYYWRVRTINDGGVSDWSDTARFMTKMPFINMIKPGLHDSLDPGIDYIVTWESNLIEDLEVCLLTNGASREVLDTTSWLRYYEWDVPLDFKYGANYQIVVSTLDGAVSDTSEAFTIMGAVDHDPVANCKDITVYLNENKKAIIDSSDVDNGSFDDIKIERIMLSATIFNCNDIGENMVTIVVTDESGNSATCEAKVTVLDSSAVCDVSIGKHHLSENLKLYPNPVENQLNIIYNQIVTAEIEMNIYDMFGYNVKEIYKGFCHPGIHEISVDLSELNSKNYILVVKSDNRMLYHKIIIIK